MRINKMQCERKENKRKCAKGNKKIQRGGAVVLWGN